MVMKVVVVVAVVVAIQLVVQVVKAVEGVKVAQKNGGGKSLFHLFHCFVLRRRPFCPSPGHAYDIYC